MLRGTDVVGTACEGSDYTVLGRCSRRSRDRALQLVWLGLPINRGKFIRVNEDVKEEYGSVRCSEGCSMVKVRSSVRQLRKER